MLLMMIEKGMPIDRIICVDTTKEFSAMYRHIQKVQEYIKSLKIEIVKIDFDYWFGEHIKTKGKHLGKAGYGWADFKNRWCTALKQEAFQCTIYGNGNYNPLKRGQTKKINKDITEYQGIAFDEIKRIENNQGIRNIKYPLVDWQITEKMALEFCYAQGFDWEGLYEKFNRVSCWCCPLQRIGELRTLYNDFPELWQRLKEMDKKSFRKFRAERTVDDLEKKFEEENKQLVTKMVMIDGGKEIKDMSLESRRWLQAEYEKATRDERIAKYRNIGINVYPVETDKGVQYGAEFIEGYEGCVGGGDSIKEAIDALYDAKKAYESANSKRGINSET
jgi:3'-phosphoadenosine 5'-phosphosulfate sulfotransferase (PAPS reductase)/FAD synthetase